MLPRKRAKLRKVLTDEFFKGINKNDLLRALEKFIDEEYDPRFLIYGSDLAEYLRSTTFKKKEEKQPNHH